MFATTEEIDQYIRMTLRQHKMEEVKFSFKNLTRSLAYFHNLENEIVFSFRALSSFARFKEVLLHELSHAIDYKERGTFEKNGRNDLHGKDFKRICSTLGIPARRFIP